MDDVQRAPGLAFFHDRGAGIEAALDQHRDQQIEAWLGEAAEERRREQERFQDGRTDSHGTNIPALPAAATVSGCRCGHGQRRDALINFASKEKAGAECGAKADCSIVCVASFQSAAAWRCGWWRHRPARAWPPT